jgi:MurNAc alpha-1-phosphate uridylyltransferase
VSILYEPEILETGGGIVNALELLGSEPFYTINSDVILIDKEKHTPALQRLAANWNPVVMDALLLLHPTERAIGYDGHGDFNITSEGQIAYYGTESTAPYVFSGVMIVKPELFSSQEVHPFSIFRDFLFKRNLQKDHTLSRVYGLVHHGDWLHVGCAKGLEQAEYYFSRQSKQLNG